MHIVVRETVLLVPQPFKGIKLCSLLDAIIFQMGENNLCTYRRVINIIFAVLVSLVWCRKQARNT